MRINELNTNGINGSQVERTQGAGGSAGRGNSRTGGSGDRVQLSGLTSRLVQLAGAESPERTARVAQLAADFKSGGYRPNAAGTSRGLVEESLARSI